MIFQPYSLQPFPKPTSQFIQQKNSQLNTKNATKNYILQLPRFFSEEKKNSKRKFLSNKYETQVKSGHSQKDKNGKKMSKLSLKYSKTEKNETPTKIKFNGKSIKIEKQKLKGLISKGKTTEFIKQKMGKRQSLMTQIDYTKPTLPNQKLSIGENSPAPSINPNKIKYKLETQEKKLFRGKRIINFIQTEQAYSQPAEIKTSRQSKLVTEETALMKNKETISKIEINNKHLFGEFMHQEQSNLMKGHQRIFSLVNKPTIKSEKIEKQQIEHLHFLEKVLRKVIVLLQRPQAKLTSQISQRLIQSQINRNFKKPFITALNKNTENLIKNIPFIAEWRFTYALILFCYLLMLKFYWGFSANYWKHTLQQCEQISSNSGSWSLKLKSQRQILFTSQNGAQPTDNKVNLALSRQQNQQSTLAVQNKSKNIGKNNEIIKSMLEGIINKRNFPYFQLFQSLMASSTQTQTFQFIAFVDKTLKWQVLKMPTYPFLPACQTKHQHYLILDLDETLIHFDPNQNMFHIRPYAQDFLRKMAVYFEVTIFTAATKEYADEIINEIDKQGNVKHRLYRNHLTFLGSQPLKDISLLGRNIKSTIIIDNLQQNFRLQMENGIEIKPWLGKGQDKVLQKVELLLLKIVNQFAEDLRKGLRLYKGFIQKQIGQKFNAKSKIHLKL